MTDGDLDLPRPHDWHEGSRRVWLFALFCAFGLVITMALAVARPWLGLLSLLAFAVLVLTVLQFGDARVVVVRTRTLDLAGEPVAATVFPLRRTGVRVGWLLLAGLAAAGAVLLARGEVVVGVAAVAAGVAGAGCWLAIHRDRGGNLPCVALCERGIVLVRGRTELIGWPELAMVGSARVHPVLDPFAGRIGRDAIVVLTAQEQREHVEFRTQPFLQDYRDEAGGTGPNVQARRLRCDPVVVYHALRFYQRREGTRPELGTVAAEHRIRARDLLI